MYKYPIMAALLLAGSPALAQVGGLRLIGDGVDFQQALDGAITTQLNSFRDAHVTVLVRDGQTQNLTRDSRHLRDLNVALSKGVLIYVCSQDLEQYELSRDKLLSAIVVIETGLSGVAPEPVEGEPKPEIAKQPSVESIARQIGAVPLARQLASGCLR